MKEKIAGSVVDYILTTMFNDVTLSNYNTIIQCVGLEYQTKICQILLQIGANSQL